MKAKKRVLLLALAAVIGIGWVLLLQSTSDEKVIKEQERLEQEADALLERKLYVRAIPKYEEAVKANTSVTSRIEAKLLCAYEEYGDMDAYAKLTEYRLKKQTVSEDELLKTAEYYAINSKLAEAVTLLRTGMETVEEALALHDYLEEIRYQHSYRVTHYTQIIPTEDSDMMPAFNGEKWGYIDASGSEKISCIYDSATVFAEDGFAAVSYEGNFYTVLQSGDWYGADDGTSYEKLSEIKLVSNNRVIGKRGDAYSYFNYDFAPLAEGLLLDDVTGNACGAAAVKRGEKWAIITDSGEAVTEYIYDEVAVNSLGNAFAKERAMVKENGVWHLIDTEGKRVGEAEYADARAPESGGYIAVADASGKWGYIDHEGNQVIDFSYHDAHSFSEHLGAVKIVNDWGYISEENQLVISETLLSAEPFHNGVALTETMDGIALIQLAYFEE